jgi:ABC-2 type transport system permease protein
VRFPFALLWFWFVQVFPAWLGIAAMVFLMQIAVAAIVHDNNNVRTFLAFINMLPAVVKTALGGDMLDSGSMTALLTIGYQHPFVMFLEMVYAVGVPAGLLTAEVQKGTMELILSRPVAKVHVYVCAAIVTVVGMFALVMVMYAGTATAVRIYTFDQPIDLPLFLRIAVTAGVLASAFAAFALLFAATFRRLYCAVGLSVAFLTLNYFIAIVAQWWPALRFVRKATLFYLIYYSDLWRGWPVRNMAILGAIALAVATVGALVWRRRDLFV